MAGTLADLVARHGGIPVTAPALREVPLEDNPDARTFADGLLAGSFDIVIFETGVGVRYLAASLGDRLSGAAWAEALGKTKVVAAVRSRRKPSASSAARSTSRSPSRTPGANARAARRPAPRHGPAGRRSGIWPAAPRADRRPGTSRAPGDPRPGLPLGVARRHRPPPRRLGRHLRSPDRCRPLHGGPAGCARAPGSRHSGNRARRPRSPVRARRRRLDRADHVGRTPRGGLADRHRTGAPEVGPSRRRGCGVVAKRREGLSPETTRRRVIVESARIA